MENAGRTLTDYLINRLDDQLQVIVTYGPDSRTIVFMRSDLHESVQAKPVFDMVDNARDMNDNLQQISSAELPTGDARFSVHAFENTITLHIFSQQEGIVIAFEPDVGRELIEFVNDCLEEINLSTLDLT